MLGNSSRRWSFSSSDASDMPSLFVKQASGTSRLGGSRKRVLGIWTFRLGRDSRLMPVRFLRCLGNKVANALSFESVRRKSSGKVSSASLARSRSLAESIDSYRHRAEDIEDCIEFLNSSSSRRSN